MPGETPVEAVEKAKALRAWVAMGGSIEVFEEVWPQIYREQTEDTVLDSPPAASEKLNQKEKEN